MKIRKSLTLVLALVMLVGCAVGGTLAWLTDEDAPITNTFTVGKIEIDLEETANTYKIVPGGESAKDPKITVASGSEKCYVYALVENNLVLDGTVVGTPNISNADWFSVATYGHKTLYRYKEIVDAASAAKELAVFTKVTYADTITEKTITELENKTIVISAYAHQSDNTTQDVADTAAKAWAGITTTTP